MRNIWTSTALNDYLKFPYLEQIFCIERWVTDLSGNKSTKEIAYGMTSLSKNKADAKRLLGLNREYWRIENQSHYVRDMTFDEDRSRVRKGAGAQVMAGLRNLAISVLRMVKATNIAKATRFLCLNPWRWVFRLLGIPS